MKYNNIEVMRKLAVGLNLTEEHFRNRTTFSGRLKNGLKAYLSGDGKYGWFLRIERKELPDLIDDVDAYIINSEADAMRLIKEFG